MTNLDPLLLRLKIPSVIYGLENYPGCKGAAGVYQNIISHIPKCDTLIVPFLGHCAITRDIKRPKCLISNDLDPFVYACWREALYYAGFIIKNDDKDRITIFKDTANGSTIILSCLDAISLLENYTFEDQIICYMILSFSFLSL